jgi:hypothetical protein
VNHKIRCWWGVCFSACLSYKYGKINSGQNSEQFEIERIKNSGKIFTDDKKTVLKKL